MSDAPLGSWRELRALFEALQDSPHYRIMSHEGGWIASGDVKEPSLDVRFRTLAERAGILLGHSQSEALFAWLDLIRDRLPHQFKHVGGTSLVRDPETGKEHVQTTDSGWVLTPCRASVELCLCLETEAVARESEGGANLPVAQERLPLPISGWQDLEVVLLSENQLQFYLCGKPSETANYAEFGLDDRRSGKPRLAWLELLKLAEGPLACRYGGRKQLEKRIQELRSALRRRFVASEDPLPLDGGRYRARFRIRKLSAFGE